MVTPKKPAYIFATLLDSLRYSMEPEPEVILHPARFSAVLGFPGDAADKYDSSNSSNSLSKLNVAYEGQDIKELFWIFDESGIKFEKKSTGGIDETRILRGKKNNFSHMPILGPVSASSAFLGASITLKALPLSRILGTLKLL